VGSVVQVYPGPPFALANLAGLGLSFGALAQLGEHLLCKQGVIGSIPISSTIYFVNVGYRSRAVVACGDALREGAPRGATAPVWSCPVCVETYSVTISFEEKIKFTALA
jgi:hypothetical protein